MIRPIRMPIPYRADHVGSLLRPPELLAARDAYADNRITAEQLRAAENAAVLKALDMQRESGIGIYSGGEYRRSGWSNIVRDAVEGLVPSAGSPISGFLGDWQGPHASVATSSSTMTTPQGAMVAAEKLRQVRRLVGTDAQFLMQHSAGAWKMTMPGALSASGQLWKAGVSDSVYPRRQDLARDLVPMLRGEIAALKADGCAYIQIDSLHYVERVADKTMRACMIESGEDPDVYLDELIA